MVSLKWELHGCSSSIHYNSHLSNVHLNRKVNYLLNWSLDPRCRLLFAREACVAVGPMTCVKLITHTSSKARTYDGNECNCEITYCNEWKVEDLTRVFMIHEEKIFMSLAMVLRNFKNRAPPFTFCPLELQYIVSSW